LLTARRLFALLAALLAVSRACHVGILWEGDAYPLAAAQQLLHGAALYRGLWFDKPPLLPFFYLLFGAQPGWPLRLADAVYLLLACWLAYRFAGELWSKREGMWAAGLLAFFLIFDLPSAVIPIASDLLMLAPHLAAVWLAARRRPFWCGAMAAVAFWISPKGAFVAAACVLWEPLGVLWIVAGFASVSAIAVACLAAMGALGPWWDEVFRWGSLYAGSPFMEHPVRNALWRTLDWGGFHVTLVLAAAWFLTRGEKRLRWVGWLAVALIGVAAGMRFFPRYYFLLLPVLVTMAARGMTLLEGRWRDSVVLLLLIPFLRFGPPYVTAVRDAGWQDTAMDRDSRAAAALVRSLAKPGDTLFVWGYRPEIYVYTGLRAGTEYLDSQPLTGVPADRHLTQSQPVEVEPARHRREELTLTRPSFVLDGLGRYNPRLAIGSYPELREWLRDYREIARTPGTVMWELNKPNLRE
jgi:hypothetical protein